MAVLLSEEGAGATTEVFSRGEPVLVPFIALMEVEYKLARKSRELADDGLDSVATWPVDVVESNEAWRQVAAQVKLKGGISLGDSWVAALALLNDAVLVHKDPEFEDVDGLQELRLPYKPRTRRA
jgi:predicted nucleic acid-binding protein